MVSEVRIYVEGGGDAKETKAAVRHGFGEFLRALRELARARRIGWRIIACGSRQSALDDFKRALKANPEAFNLLLVDSEGPVANPALPWQHLRQKNGWEVDVPPLRSDQCHLMVQALEAWLIADVDALDRFYGQGFNRNPIPKARNVEDVDKAALAPALKAATRGAVRGEYHKTRHAPRIMATLDVAKVRSRAPFCERLFNTLAERIGGAA